MDCALPQAHSRVLSLEILEERQVMAGGATALVVPTAVLPTNNLATSPGFETDLGNTWVAWGVNVERSTAQSHSGVASAFVSARQEAWHGLNYTLSFPASSGDELALKAWVRLASGPKQLVNFTLRQVDDAGVRFFRVTQNEVGSDGWTEVRGGTILSVAGTLRELTLLIEGPSVGTSFYVDDVSIGTFEWKSAADARIEQIRKGNAVVRLTDQFNQPINGATVEIKQIDNAFGFGSAINSNVLTNTDYANFAKRAFDWGTLEYEATWPSNEPARGVRTQDVADAMIQWARQNGMKLRGHHIIDAQRGPTWLAGLSPQDQAMEVSGRVTDALTHYQGQFEHWDVFNEMLHGKFYENLFGPLFKVGVHLQAQGIDPNVEKFVNDFNIIEGSMVEEYKDLIRWLQSYGVEIDGIGVQSHLPGQVEPFTILSRFDSLAELGLPIWSTEFDVSAANENVLADEIEKYLRLAFSHPAVEGVMLWDFFAGSPSRDPSRMLMDSDGRINAAGQRYLQLREEWSTRVAAVPIAQGSVGFRGFLGTYEAIVTLADGSTYSQRFDLTSTDSNDVTLSFSLSPKIFAAGNPFAWIHSDYTTTLIGLDYLGRPQFTPSFTFELDWNNDGVYEEAVAGTSITFASHQFETWGPQTFSYRVRDLRGAVSDPASMTVWVMGFVVLEDFNDPSFKHLFWIGTPGDDTILFTRLAGGGVQANVSMLYGIDESRQFQFDQVNGVVIPIGVAGKDTVSNLTGTASSPEASRTSASSPPATEESGSVDLLELPSAFDDLEFWAWTRPVGDPRRESLVDASMVGDSEESLPSV